MGEAERGDEKAEGLWNREMRRKGKRNMSKRECKWCTSGLLNNTCCAQTVRSGSLNAEMIHSALNHRLPVHLSCSVWALSAYSCKRKKGTIQKWGQILCPLSYDPNHWFQTIGPPPSYLHYNFTCWATQRGLLMKSHSWCLIKSAIESSYWFKENISLVGAHFKHSLYCLWSEWENTISTLF